MKIETRDKEIAFGDVGISACAINKRNGRPLMRIQAVRDYNTVYLDTGELERMNLNTECIRVNAKVVIEK